MPRLILSTPKIVAEVIDGEAIILDLREGVYFATEGVGAVVWAAAIEGRLAHSISESASVFFGDQANAGDEVKALLDSFVVARLLTVSPESDHILDSEQAPFDPIVWPSTYKSPILERHDDLQDMMQLDPIHDTDASGWPMPAPAVSADKAAQ